MLKVVTADEMREIDRAAIEDFGIPGVVLMENAGRGAAHEIENFILEHDLNKVLILAGKGNNGGDGFVAARHLVNIGIDCEVCLAGKKSDVKGDARGNLDIALQMGISIYEIVENISCLEKLLSVSDVIVDALLGTGLKQEVKAFSRGIIAAVNFSELPVISLDIPSGIDSTTGFPLGTAIEADMTVTFCLPKLGTILYPGADYSGELILADIGAPYELLRNEEIKTNIVTKESISKMFLPRDANSHKGTYGHLLVVAGSAGKSGAAVMTAQAAMRSGTGLVTVAAPSAISDNLEVKLTEAMMEALSCENGMLKESAAEEIINLLKNKSTAVIGPGLSRTTATGKVVKKVVRQLGTPAVIDADALWHLSDCRDLIKDRDEALILTPHPGEMAHLVGITTKEVQENRIAVARDFSVENSCYLVLKGARTIVATPDGEVYINTTGNPGMATGGTGDVLCGMIGAFLSQGYSSLDSSLMAVYLHGLAGDDAAQKKGEAGLIATDIINYIPSSIVKLTP